MEFKLLLLFCLNLFLTYLQSFETFDFKSSLDFEDADFEKDFQIWSSIASSLAKWSQAKLDKMKKYQSLFNQTKILKRIRRDEEMVCYHNFGCFRDEGPFDYLDTLPAPPETINTTFVLYTRDNPKQGELLDYTNSSTLINSNFKDKSLIKLIIHGFGCTGKDPWVLQMTEALLFVDDLNVIVVDWGNGAALPNYVQAAANTQLVGKQIALLIKWIIFEKSLSAKDFHLIGFSLGAHIAGFAGMEIANISRITGLDPASPLFEGYDEKARLDPNDAQFVDVIHSNGDSFLRGGLGSFQPMGHVDFYPNGGRNQVGCNSVLVGAISDIFYRKWQSLCHHRRAFRFFIDSIVPTCHFSAFGCESYEKFLRGECFECGKNRSKCGNMGYFADKSLGRGKMYLVTRDKEPFCANQYKIQVKNSKGQSSTWGKIEITFLSKDKNETFQLTSESDEIQDNNLIQGLVVAHPLVRNITNTIIKYTKYRGWIYSGREYWAIDKIALTENGGEKMMYCGQNTVLDDNISVKLPLDTGTCGPSMETQNTISVRLAKLIWSIISKQNKSKPTELMWQINVKPEESRSIYLSDYIRYYWKPK